MSGRKRKSNAGAGGGSKRLRRSAGHPGLTSAQSSRSSRLTSITKRLLLEYARFLDLDVSMHDAAKIIADTIVRHEASSEDDPPSTTDIKAGTFRVAPGKGKEPSGKGKGKKPSSKGKEAHFEADFQGDNEDLLSCVHCAADVPSDNVYCETCGKDPTTPTDAPPTTWACNACSKEDNTANFCGECGGARVHTCSTCNAAVEGKFCGACGTSRVSKPQEKKPGMPPLPSASSLLGSLATGPFPTSSLFSLNLAELERFSKCPKVQHTLLFTTPRNVRTALAALRYVPLQQMRPRSLVQAHGDVFSKKGTVSVGESGALSVSTGAVKQPEISSQDDMLSCLRNLHRLEALLAPAKSPTNLADFDMITRLLASCPWRAVYTFVEEARIANDGKIDHIGEPAGVQLTDLLTQVRRGTAGSNHSSQPTLATSTPRGANRSLGTPRVKKEGGKERLPQALANETVEKSLCLAFQKGACKETSDHEITTRKDNKKIKVAHRCTSCNGGTHGALACPKRG
jgi:hypothetical protein